MEISLFRRMEANGQDPLRDFSLKNNFCVLGDTEVLAHDLTPKLVFRVNPFNFVFIIWASECDFSWCLWPS